MALVGDLIGRRAEMDTGWFYFLIGTLVVVACPEMVALRLTGSFASGWSANVAWYRCQASPQERNCRTGLSAASLFMSTTIE